MLIGVVVPAFNAAAWIGDAISSVLAQSHEDWALVVVDDGSTDGMGDVVAGFADQRVRLIRQANAGVSAARNTGVAHFVMTGDADSVLFLDADDTLAPDALSRLVSALENTPRAVAAVGAYTIVGTRRVRQLVAGDILPRLLVRNLLANGGHVLIRAEAVGAGFRTDLAYGEDWEFWARLALQGLFAAVDGAPVLYVRQHDGGAYRRLASDPASFAPCMQAIFGNPALIARFGADRLAAIRRRTEAENAWVVGRELIRHGQPREGRAWLRRSLRAAPSIKRAALLAGSLFPVGPFVRYARANLACNEPTRPCGRKMMKTTSRVP